jgi:hypothetical protein
MGVYTALLSLAAFVGALCAGFILAQAPRQRATQLAALLASSASWWALCEARWNSTADPETALLWMRLSAPGWVFLCGLVPHLMGRYLDLCPSALTASRRRRLLRAAAFGYALGGVILLLALSGRTVFGEMLRVPWGWI